jgi:hypothetical protein
MLACSNSKLTPHELCGKVPTNANPSVNTWISVFLWQIFHNHEQFDSRALRPDNF